MTNLKELKIGETQDIIVMVKNITNAIASNGNPYQKVMVRDTEDNEMTFFNWNAPIVANASTIIRAKVKTEEYRSSEAVKLLEVEEAVGANVTKFMPKSHLESPSGTWNELVAYSRNMRPGLRKIVGSILMQEKEKFYVNPLTADKSFSRQNGILEATSKLTKTAYHAAKTTGLDEDLILAGAMLYYVGSVDTVDSAYNYTPEDVLIGAGMNASNKVMMKVRDIMDGDDEEMKGEIKSDDVKLLCHILTSRFKGIPTAIPEAVTLRYLDGMLMEIDSMESALNGVESGELVSQQYHKIYKR